MASATFSYTPIKLAATEANPAGSTAYRPLAFATITAKSGQSRRVVVLLDSGADACVFPLSLALLLGVNVLKLPRSLTAGVGSQANTTYHEELAIDLGEGISFSARVGFTAGMEAIGIGLLGQQGFFERFNVEFRRAENIFRVTSMD